MHRRAAIVICTLVVEAFLGWIAVTIHHAGYAIRYEPLAATAVPQSPPDTEKRALAILTRTMNSVSKVESGFCPIEFTALREWVKTHGVLCGCMAYLYHGYLDRAGIPSRVVNFATDLDGPTDTHATVEVALNGKWVILDPTFHVRFWLDGRPLGARDLMNLYYRHESDQIHTQFLGNVTYPARFKEYYIDYRLLPQHVYYIHLQGLIGNSFLSNNDFIVKVFRKIIVPVRYFYRAAFYATPDSPKIATEMAARYATATRLGFTATVAIPMAMLAVLIGAAVVLITVTRRSEQHKDQRGSV